VSKREPVISGSGTGVGLDFDGEGIGVVVDTAVAIGETTGAGLEDAVLSTLMLVLGVLPVRSTLGRLLVAAEGAIGELDPKPGIGFVELPPPNNDENKPPPFFVFVVLAGKSSCTASLQP
jgi:hypothetical protein